MTFKQWAYEEVLTHTDLNALARTGVPRFASTTARGAALANPEKGQLSSVDGVLQQFDGTAWRTLYLLPPGGSTGQVLKKVSNADGDVTWTNP